jgi:hypothetical protein
MTRDEVMAIMRTTKNLEGADLGGANLEGANLEGADLRGANLRYANLRYANLRRADLRGANLRYANLERANLERANLRGANLERANLERANLERADLRGANLRYANLRYANLRRADLERADLERADLRDAKLPDFLIVPEEGSFIGWKKLANKTILKLEIPKEAKRTNSLVGRKCRAEFVKVLEAFGPLGESKHYSSFKYSLEEIVRPDSYNDDIRIECTNGIHFFITRKEAEEY